MIRFFARLAVVMPSASILWAACLDLCFGTFRDVENDEERLNMKLKRPEVEVGYPSR